MLRLVHVAQVWLAYRQIRIKSVPGPSGVDGPSKDNGATSLIRGIVQDEHRHQKRIARQATLLKAAQKSDLAFANLVINDYQPCAEGKKDP